MTSTVINIAKLQKKLRKELDDDRYRHTLGVMYTAAALAMRYDCNLNDAQVAGLLHDCAKCIPNDKKIKLCQKYQIPIRDVEMKAPSLLHSKLGAYLARTVYHIENEEILSAIEWHTTGKPDMTMLEKIIFLADYIEPMRFKASNLPEIRKQAFIDIDHAVYLTLRDTIAYLGDRNDALDENTWLTYDFYLKRNQQKASHTDVF